MEKYQRERNKNGTGTRNRNGNGAKNENGARARNEGGTRTKNQGTVPEQKKDPEEERYQNQEQCSVPGALVYIKGTSFSFGLSLDRSVR